MFDTPEVIFLVHNLSRRRDSNGAKALIAGGVISCKNDVVKSWWMLNASVWKSPPVSGQYWPWTLSFPHAPEAFPSNIRLLAIFVINHQCGFFGDWRLYSKNLRISLLFRIPSRYNGGGHDWQIPYVAISFWKMWLYVPLISTSTKWSPVELVMYWSMRFWDSLRCILFKPNLCQYYNPCHASVSQFCWDFSTPVSFPTDSSGQVTIDSAQGAWSLLVLEDPCV